jgi:uncharacterized Rossmann fold enzyme
MTTATMQEPKAILDASQKQEVVYAVPLWLRDQQILQAIQRVPGRIQPVSEPRSEPIAVVCFGPSLRETWEQVRDFKYVITCSGAHKFLRARGIDPDYHVEVDPRAHKTALIGEPCPTTEYLIASTCHSAVFDHLDGYDVKLWHVFDSTEDALRTLPRGEWAIMGGCSVGLRSLGIAAFLGFRDLHVFGMDGSEGPTGKHASDHPNQPTGFSLTEYPVGSGTMWKTTASMLECARQTWHELDQLPNVKATFYGHGLVQEMAKHYVPNPTTKDKPLENLVAFKKPDVISPEYRALNAQLHRENLGYGVGGGNHAKTVLKLAESLKTTSILDYGCGKGYLAKQIPFPIWEYDPAIPGKDESPRPADLVVCTDVLEHIEPELLPYVLDDLRRCVRQVGYFVIHTGAAQKTLADGRNAHLIQEGAEWWKAQLASFFTVGTIKRHGPLLYVVVAPTPPKAPR